MTEYEYVKTYMVKKFFNVDKTLIEDAIQNAYLIILENKCYDYKKSQMTSFLITLASNNLLNELKRRKKIKYIDFSESIYIKDENLE